jgi:hypothetical protein
MIGPTSPPPSPDSCHSSNSLVTRLCQRPCQHFELDCLPTNTGYTYIPLQKTLDSAPEQLAVPDKFDPYREALVMETDTVWPVEYDDLPPSEKVVLEHKLHADPAACPQLEYVRTHTGFCRQITVTSADVQRLSG